MGKRGRQYANILERLDDLSGILARLDAITPAPDAGTTTYHATSDPEIWLKRTIAEVPAREAMHWYARMTTIPPLEHLIDQCREGRERAEEAFQRSTRTPADTDAYG